VVSQDLNFHSSTIFRDY